MGNIQAGTSGSSLNASPDSIIDAIARASKEASRLREEAPNLNRNKSSAFESYDDDCDSSSDYDEGREDKKGLSNSTQNQNEIGKSIPLVVAKDVDPIYPWLISTKNDLEILRVKNKAVKDVCISNYPGRTSSYIDKIKWAETNSRSIQNNGDLGDILREVIYDKSPEEILIQVLIRKRSLNAILSSNEGMAKVFLDMFINASDKLSPEQITKEQQSYGSDATSTDTEYKQHEKHAPGIPNFYLRPNAPKLVYDDTKPARERLTNYIKWIMDESDSGTVLSPKPFIVPNEANVKMTNTTQSALVCFFHIKANKRTLFYKGIAEPTGAVIKLLPGYRIINIGPSPLPPRFVTKLLNIEPDTKVGCLPHFLSHQYCNSNDVQNNNENAPICAAIEIMISHPTHEKVQLCSPILNTDEYRKPEKSLNSKSEEKKGEANVVHTNSKKEIFRDEKTPEAFETIYHADRLYVELIFLKRKNPETTFFLVNTAETAKNLSYLTNSQYQYQQMSMETHFSVVWLSSYFDTCYPRIYAHCIRGKGESMKVRSQTVLSNGMSIEDIGDYYYYKFELLESNLGEIIENRRHLSQAKQLCNILAFTLVVTLDAAVWEKQTLETNDVCGNFSELLEDLGTFWKSILKNRDEDICLGLTNAEGCASRRSLVELLNYLEQKIQSSYGHLLEHKQKIDFGGSINIVVNEEATSNATGIKRKLS